MKIPLLTLCNFGPFAVVIAFVFDLITGLDLYLVALAIIFLQVALGCLHFWCLRQRGETPCR
tara:strand:- start:818 stop:1003 length:186 start_codon:yes stop_codon:yes gene_type:complete